MNTIEKQIKATLSTMTVREKIGQCIMIEPFFLFEALNAKELEPYEHVLDPRFLNKILNEYHIGFLLFGGVSTIGDDSSKEWADYISGVNDFSKKANIKVPLLFGADAVHGANFIKNSTIFSHNLGVAATWNVELTKEYAISVGKELQSIGINCNFAPTIDVARDQRWGRVYETLGEDPFLASKMSEALVLGMQDNNQVAACAKHYIGYGESSNGMDRTPADISDRNIYEIHLPPFKSAIKANVQTIMVNGGDVNGVPLPLNKHFLQDVLRDELGFKGIILSDWEDVNRLHSRHHVARSREDAILKSFNAGLDLNMAVTDLKTVDVMEQFVKDGKISMDRLNEAVSNVLRVKYELGLFEQSDLDENLASALCGNHDSRALAKQIALESITLLKNNNHILPLSKDLKRILITGPVANSKRHLSGGWTLGWDSAKEDDLDYQTILDAIHKKLPNAAITYIDNLEELQSDSFSTKDYDICISIVGETPHAEWLGDSFDLAIEEPELNLLKAAHATNLPIVMVSVIGRPVDVSWVHEHIPSILWAYIPGSEGAGAIVDVLFGDHNPSGKLPITFPKNANQIPIVYNARKYTSFEINTRYDPIYPFGFGLSYTTFSYSNLTVESPISKGASCHVSVDVENTGSIKGVEVVQLYLEDQYATVTRPLKSLKGFARIELDPHQTKTVKFVLTPHELGLFNEFLNWEIQPRDIEVQVGELRKQFTIL